MPTSLPMWTPPASHCWSLPEFYTVDQYPVRSPLAVADFLAPRVAGKALCEIGTRNGDIAACLAHHATSVTAIELDQEYCKKLRARGLRVLCRPVEAVGDADFAGCEVYFWWPMDAEAQNERWLRQLLAAHRSIGTNATIFVAHDTHYDKDMRMLPRLAKHYGAHISRVFFDEGGPLEGEASYATPFFSRPGRWGVFHLARFSAGPAETVRRGTASSAPARIREPTAHASPAAVRHGFCSVTEDALGVGDCVQGHKGTVKLQDAEFGSITSVDTCADWCVQFCARCRYVSFSLAANDCSWYHQCDLDHLNQQFRTYGHVSREVSPSMAQERSSNEGSDDTSLHFIRGQHGRGRGRAWHRPSQKVRRGSTPS